MLAQKEYTQEHKPVVGGGYMVDKRKVSAYSGSEATYARAPKPGIPTYTEAWALIEAARRMATASDHANLDDIKDRNKVRDSIRLNWRLWTIFQAEMSTDEQEAVPDEIRVNMLTLCKFIDHHTVETLSDLSPSKISTLIEINRNIAAGLLESLKQFETAADAATGKQAGEEPEQELTGVMTVT